MQLIRHIIPLLLFIVPIGIHAQTESEMRKQADQLFNTGKYVDATPLYMRLLSLQPRDYGYNYHYGACLLFNSNKKQEALKYLNYANQDPSTQPDIFYFLGKALHLNYQFNEAIYNYSAYRKSGQNSDFLKEAERLIEMCQNGKRLLSSITDIIVLDKKEIAAEKFFRLYDLKDIGGNILVTLEFQSKLDKKFNHQPIIHFPQQPKRIYYASYGETGGSGKDIYVRIKQADGKWGEPELVKGGINTPYDEDFPYMHPDGQYLYFASKGHNSMGGYDIFRCRYDEDKQVFGQAENLDFAISSPDDDVFFVLDSLNRDAFFASARQSEAGKLTVYKVKVDRVPLQLAVLKGNFVSRVDPSIKKVRIEVLNAQTGKKVGSFQTDAEMSYMITLPKGGDFEFIVKLDDRPQEYRSKVSVPYSKEFRPLKQQLVHSVDEGNELVRVLNQFDEPVEDQQAILAEVIRNRSVLNVNVEDFDLSAFESTQAARKVFAELGLAQLNNAEVIDVLNELVAKGKQQQLFSTAIDQNVNNLVSETANDIIAIEEQIKSKVAESNAAQSAELKYGALKEAQELIEEQNTMRQYAERLMDMADSVNQIIEKSAIVRNQRALSSIAESFDKLVNDGKQGEAWEQLKLQVDMIGSSMRDRSGNVLQNQIDRQVTLEEQLTDIRNKRASYDSDIKKIEKDITLLQSALQSAKKKDQPAIQAAIDKKKEEALLIDQETKQLADKENKLLPQLQMVRKEIAVIQDAVSNKPVTKVERKQAVEQLAQSSSKNTTTLHSFVDQQVAQLETSNPELKERYAASNRAVQDVFAEYEQSKDGIANDPNLSSDERVFRQLENDRRSKEILDRRLGQLQRVIKEDRHTDQTLQEEKTVKRYMELIDASIVENERIVAQRLAKNGVADQSTVLNSVDPQFEEDIQFIEQDANLTSSEKKSRLNQRDEQLTQSVEASLKRVDQELINQPEDAQLKAKKETLLSIKQETQARITARNSEVEPLDSKDPVTEKSPENITKKQSATEVLVNSYKTDQQAVENNTALSTENKWRALEGNDQVLLSALKERNEVINRVLQTSPTDPVLKEEQETIANQIAVVESSSEERKQLAHSQVIGQLASEQKQVVKAGFASEKRTQYEQSKAKVNSTPEVDNISKHIEQIDQLLESISVLKSQKEKELANDVYATEIIQQVYVLKEWEQELLQEKVNMESLKKEAESKLALAKAREQQPENTNQSSTNTAAEITALNTDFDNIVAQRQRSVTAQQQQSFASEKEKITVQFETQKAYTSQLEELLDRQEKVAEKVPSDATLTAAIGKTKDAVRASKAQEEGLQTSLTKLNTVELSPVVASAELIVKALPTYDAQRKTIEESKMEESKKQQQLIQLEESLLTALKNDQKKVQDRLRQQTDDKSLNILNETLSEVIAVQAAKVNKLKDEEQQRQLRLEEEFVASIRAEFAPEINQILSDSPSTDVVEMKRQLQLVERYEEQLIARKNQPMATDPSQVIEVLNKELNVVSEKKKRLKITIGDLEKIAVVQPDIDLEGPTDQSSVKTQTRENEIQERINSGDADKREIKALQVELAQIQEEKSNKETAVLRQNQVKNNAEIVQLEEKTKEISALNASTQRNHNIAEMQVAELEKDKLALEKSLEKTKRTEEQVYVLKAIEENQKEMKQTLEEEYLQNKWSALSQEAGVNSLESVEELAVRKRRYVIQIGELTKLISYLDEDVKTAKRKDIPAIQQERKILVNRRELIQASLDEVEKLSAVETIKINPTVPSSAKNQPISFEEEIEIANSKDYADYVKLAEQAINAEQEYLETKAQIARTKQTLKSLVATSVYTESDKQEIDKSVGQLKQLELRLVELEKKWNTMKIMATEKLPREEEAALKMQNLVLRGITPIDQAVIAKALVPLPESGLEIVPKQLEKAIPLELKNPTGLVYRVQVGAFAKPIPEELFKEFNPVSGESIPNSKIMRYMAGFFNNSKRVVEARNQIRQLGYADAFAVAYCDGKRISLAEARRLEQAGLCVPKGNNELMLEVAVNTLEKQVVDDTTKRPKVNELDYNKATGAAPAQAAEQRKGLFFTVQVGVFNRPISANTVYQLPPLITYRMPNGQIRYSIGVFSSVEEARGMQQKAKEKGIADAFITAYYKGERIAIQQAIQLLETEGSGILENKPASLPKPTPIPDPVPTVKETIATQARTAVDEPIVSTKKERIQLVTKKQFTVYPREELNRYNAQGSFYFDERDGRVKSAWVRAEEELPPVYYFRTELDTIRTEVHADTLRFFQVKFEKEIPGDVNEMYIRLNCRKEIRTSESGIEMRIFESREEQREEIRKALRLLNVSWKEEIELPVTD